MDEHEPQLSLQWTADRRSILKMSSSSTSSWWASSMGGKDLSDIMIPLFLMDFRDLLSPLEWTWETTFIWTDLRVLISPKSWTLFLMEAWSWTGKDLFRCLKIHWSKIWICAEYFVTKHNWIILVWKILRRLLSQLSKIKMLFQIFCKIFPWFFGDISANMTSAASLLVSDLRTTSDLGSDWDLAAITVVRNIQRWKYSSVLIRVTLSQGRNIRPLISLQTLHTHSLLENPDTCPDCPCCCCP